MKNIFWMARYILKFLGFSHLTCHRSFYLVVYTSSRPTAEVEQKYLDHPRWVILEDSGHSFSFDPGFVKLLWNVGSSVVILKGTT